MDGRPGAGGRSDTGVDLGVELELDQLLAQLIERAQDVRSAHSRLRGLLQANQSIIADLSLEIVLRRIVEAACTLLDARYGALGVLSPDGQGLEQFVHVGIDHDTVDRIGDLPQGKGVLGALIEHPQPITLHELSEDPRSVGFPAGHPPMHTFLGVPITIRGEVYGNLYLTERSRGDFTAEDVELASAFAATAAVAIENARLFEDARRRQEWLRATGEMSLRLASAAGAEDPLRVLVNQLHRLAAADVVTLVLPDAAGERLRVEVAVGTKADKLEGASYALTGTFTEQVLSTGEPVLITGAETDPDPTMYLREIVPVGPAMVLPLAGQNRVRGTLVVARLAPGHLFTPSDLEMATAFAGQAAIALELAETRRDRERMQLYEDRDRIARDLHDHVIQQLFAAGLTLQSVGMGLAGSPLEERIGQVVDSLDESIRQIRASIFELRDKNGPAGGVRAAVLGLVAELTDALGFDPAVRFNGPVDTVIDGSLRDDLLAVVREALTNTARHAGAAKASVWISATAERVDLRVSDDGSGLGEPARRSGLDNIAARAERRGGTFAPVEAAEDTGTTLVWSVPVVG